MQSNTVRIIIVIRFNDVEYRWVSYQNWTYSLVFALTKEQVNMDNIMLDCHGIDTVASVYLNGGLVNTTDNMFVR